MIDVIALLVKLLGVGFLLIATIGLLRFDDTLQRMHAATKAGTLGAGLVLVGAMLNKATTSATMTGSLTVLFLLLTIPVASHLLARAAYISGSKLEGIDDTNDALRGVLERPQEPVERQSERVDIADPMSGEAGDPVAREAAAKGFASLKDVVAPARIRFAAIGETAPQLGRRAADFAARTSLPMTAVVAIDQDYADATDDTAQTLDLMRTKVGSWMPDLSSMAQTLGVTLNIVYEEGDAAASMAGVGDGREFLVLPTDGWADHDVGVATPHATKEPDGLLRVAELHPGPTLYAVDEQKAGPLAVLFDGSLDVWRALDLALVEGLWKASEVRIFGFVDSVSRAEIEQRAAEASVPVKFSDPGAVAPENALFPNDIITDAIAVILPDLPHPLRTRWYGVFWQDKISPGWRGDVLVWT
ncbi:MAG: monovalent cation/H(+) antiporter subunit G [Devosiaceae bacterium]